jgi:hypothetical protein
MHQYRLILARNTMSELHGSLLTYLINKRILSLYTCSVPVWRDDDNTGKVLEFLTSWGCARQFWGEYHLYSLPCHLVPTIRPLPTIRTLMWTMAYSTLSGVISTMSRITISTFCQVSNEELLTHFEALMFCVFMNHRSRQSQPKAIVTIRQRCSLRSSLPQVHR